MALKPVPRLILIAAVIGGAVWGFNKFFDMGALRATTTASTIPTGIDVPVATTDAVRRGVAHHFAPQQVRLERLAGPGRAAGRDHHDVRGDQTGCKRGS